MPLTRNTIAAILISCLPISASGQDLPWHLDTKLPEQCESCLSIQSFWDRFGTGHSNISTLVVETNISSATRTAFEWHEGFNSPRFHILHADPEPRFIRPLPSDLNVTNLYSALLESIDGVSAVLEESARSEPPNMCSRVFSTVEASPRNHDLYMSSIIGSESGQGASGVAPASSVLLTQATLGQDLTERIRPMLLDRPNIRVVNISQGPSGLVEFRNLEQADLPWVHYQKLRLATMRLAPFGIHGSQGNSKTRFLFVAAAGNSPSFATDAQFISEPLDRRIPQQAIYLSPVRQNSIDIRPQHLSLLPQPSLPLLVVGAVGPNGELPSYGRDDPGINIFAPSGLDWRSYFNFHRPNTEYNDRSLRIAPSDWPVCKCLKIAETTKTDLSVFPEAPHLRDRIEACKTLDSRLLGIPTFDFPLDPGNGSNSFTCRPNGPPFCTTLTDGTSAATAIVSGVASLLFYLDPTLSGEDVANIIIKTADTGNPFGRPTIDPNEAGKYIVNEIANRALRGVLDGYWVRVADQRPIDEAKAIVDENFRLIARQILHEQIGSGANLNNIISYGILGCPPDIPPLGVSSASLQSICKDPPNTTGPQILTLKLSSETQTTSWIQLTMIRSSILSDRTMWRLVDTAHGGT